MAVARGSLVMVDYTARIKDGAIFDTTREPDGKKAGLDSDKKYGPVLVSVGDRWVLEGFDDALDGAEEGKDISVEVPPAKGFGEVSYSKIRVMRSRKLGDDEEKVSVGDEVQIDGRRGVIRLMASGRIKVDFNHKYAGKTLVYEARVARLLEADGDKISAILERHFDGAGHAVLVRGRAGAVGSGVEQRDMAIVYGASAAVTLVYRDGEFSFPGERRSMSGQPGALAALKSRASEGDVLIMASADTPLAAEMSAKNAALHTASM